MKLFSAVALAALVAGSAGATSVLGMSGDLSSLPDTGGSVTITLTLAPDASGINNYNFDLDSASSGPSVTDTAAANVGFGPAGFVMAEAFGPPILSGVGHVDQISQSSVGANGPTSGTFTIATATFTIGAGAPGDTVTFFYQTATPFTEFFFADNGNNSVTPTSSATWTVTLIPEPGTLALLGFGLSGLAIVGRRRS